MILLAYGHMLLYILATRVNPLEEHINMKLSLFAAVQKSMVCNDAKVSDSIKTAISSIKTAISTLK